ncbi:MAG: PIN domain-containing protein [Acidobacteriota bacterium]|jgi:predicted nucleic acid-binding protein|nr:PIN domain-containing protein [Acidobacteriota bacterium]
MMVTSFRVVLDACVLVPVTLCDTLLTLADRRLYVPLWSAEILNEMERAVTRLAVERGMTGDNAAKAASYRRSEMERTYPDSAVRGYEALIPVMTNDEKDRHVLAASVRGRADLIVTSNTADFPQAAAQPYDIQVVTPDDFLQDVLEFDERLVVEAIRDMTAQKKRPPMTELDMLKRIAKSAPNFAASVLSLLGS